MTRAVVRGSWNEPGTAVAGTSWVITVAADVALGLLFLLGGPRGISSPSFAVLRDVGGYTVAGTAFMLVGILIAVSPAWSAKALSAALMVGCVLHLLLAAGFWVAIINEPPLPLDAPHAALIGPVPFAFMAAVHLIRARFYWRLKGDDA